MEKPKTPRSIKRDSGISIKGDRGAGLSEAKPMGCISQMAKGR
ncbi:unnamed protein product, partial [marine sediment metagenome]